MHSSPRVRSWTPRPLRSPPARPGGRTVRRARRPHGPTARRRSTPATGPPCCSPPSSALPDLVPDLRFGDIPPDPCAGHGPEREPDIRGDTALDAQQEDARLPGAVTGEGASDTRLDVRGVARPQHRGHPFARHLFAFADVRQLNRCVTEDVEVLVLMGGEE